MLIVYLNTEAIAPMTPVPGPQGSREKSSVNSTVGSPSSKVVTIDMAQLDWPESLARDPFATMTNQDGHMQSADDFTAQQGAGVDSLGERSVALPPLQLTAVTLNPEPRLAMINRKLVTVGECVEDLCVTKITSDGVWLDGPSGPYHLVFDSYEQASSMTDQQIDGSVRRPGGQARSVRRDT
ncbi:MAG: hypothetical protein NPIRA04_28810 [Nitrospirales bacterium]|nr:MAG: hypothetical protein NPIRA04_28810 [Nitrospirales bacterium]